MASPDLESRATISPAFQDSTYSGRNSLGQHSGIGSALSRASSIDSSQHGTDHGAGAAAAEFDDVDAEWGPQHPCYPHLNPYVPLSSPLYQSTRIIRIRRDWLIAGDLAPTFSGLYPVILADAGLGEGEFRRVIELVNAQLIEIFKPWAWGNVLDAVLGLVTGWVWDDLGQTSAKRKLRGVEEVLERWNIEQERRVAAASASGMVGGGGESRGVSRSGVETRNGGEVAPLTARFIGLRESGYLSLDIQIPTPRIGVEAEEGEGEEGVEEREDRESRVESRGKE